MSANLRGFVVGEESIFVVGMEGVVESITDDWLTIGGVQLPRRLDHNKGVRYLSVLWPDAAPCDREHCGSTCDPEPADSDARDDLDALAAMIRAAHEDRHFSESMRFCNDPICREVFELDGAR